jgi:hypothetical protein
MGNESMDINRYEYPPAGWSDPWSDPEAALYVSKVGALQLVLDL